MCATHTDGVIPLSENTHSALGPNATAPLVCSMQQIQLKTQKDKYNQNATAPLLVCSYAANTAQNTQIQIQRQMQPEALVCSVRLNSHKKYKKMDESTYKDKYSIFLQERHKYR